MNEMSAPHEHDRPDDDPQATTRLTRRQAREVDRYAIEQLGLPGLILMENAGINASGAIFDLLSERYIIDEDSAAVAILCGGGNNGGDGYVVARQLHAWGLTPTVYALKPPADLTGDAAVNAKVCQRLALPIVELPDALAVDRYSAVWQRAHIVVDAMLGTGFSGQMQLREPIASAIRAVNDLAGPSIVCLDLPSGLDCDSGQPSPSDEGPLAVRADLTITFVAHKVGFAQPEAKGYLGKIVTADIGLPHSIADAVR